MWSIVSCSTNLERSLATFQQLQSRGFGRRRRSVVLQLGSIVSNFLGKVFEGRYVKFGQLRGYLSTLNICPRGLRADGNIS